MKRKKSIGKRYIFLIFLAVLPFYKFYHPEDYCFGDKDLVVVWGFIILFTIPFLVILFYNLYEFSLKKILFDFRPVIILVLFLIGLYIAFNHQHNIFFKKEILKFKITNSLKGITITLYEDSTFVLQKSFTNYDCFYNGEFDKKNDTLLFKIPQKINDLEDTYIYNTERGTLKSLKTKKTTYREILID